MKETHFRSIVKGITWRFIASMTTMAVVFAVTGNLELVAAVGFVDITIKILFYYTHERVWGKVHWGMLGTEPNLK